MMSLLVWLNTIKKMDCRESVNTGILRGAITGLKGNHISPISDCNSNNLPVSKESIFLCSSDSIHDCSDFLQDNSDYQWFLDYGYKDSNYSHHPSVLSISGSQDLVYYEHMSRNLDANLAEVDMDDFNREDIHSVLSSLPNIPGVEEREMFASVTGSMMVKFGLDESFSPHSSSQEEANNSASMCKSQPLFSPVHENFMPHTNLSIDSLDLSENDINLMVTCQGNKHNYTIAFEGSTTMGPDELETKETENANTVKDLIAAGSKGESKKNQENLNEFSRQAENEMARSDSPFTTWSKIKKNSNENLQLRRHPSGNNNTTDSSECPRVANTTNTMKSLSLPNLFRENQKQFSGLSGSVKFDKNFGTRGIDCEPQCIKLYDVQNSGNSKSVDHSAFSSAEKPPRNFSLMKLFIKQKSGSHETVPNHSNDSANNRYHNDREETENDRKLAEAKNSRMNEINKTKINHSFLNIIENSAPKNDGKEFKLEVNCSKMNSKKVEDTKFTGSDNQTNEGFDSGHENVKYFSDESTQENGSNTESAENLMCHCAKSPVHNDLKRIVTEKSIQTSKLCASHENSSKSKSKVPVYILYPNYSLPNLEFLKKKHYVQNIDLTKVFVRPQKFQAPGSQASTPRSAPGRPFSVNDIESLKKTGFKHVKDWESLTFLLPKEYKQFLQEIPEIVSHLKEVKNQKEELVPLFCLSPPPNRKLKTRPASCDLNSFNNEYRNSNYSSPSSGFRGSSTILNSNNSSNVSSPKNPSHSEFAGSRRSGASFHGRQFSRNLSEATPHRVPLPKGILRNNSLDGQQYMCKNQKENANKRYSMIEFTEKNSDVEEKCRRRSSQNFSLHPSASKKIQKKVEKQSGIGCESISKKSNKVPKEEMNLGENFYLGETSKIQNDLKRLEELLEISAAFGENVESFTENDMMKLRSQVSKFLTMHQHLERVSETLQTVDEVAGEGNNICGEKFEGNESSVAKSLNAPHNTPEHKKQGETGVANDINKELEKFIKVSGKEAPEFLNEACENFPADEAVVGMRKTVSFAERISFAAKDCGVKLPLMPSPESLLMNQKTQQANFSTPLGKPFSEEPVGDSTENLTFSGNQLCTSTELLRKKGLILDVKSAAEKIVCLSKGTMEEATNVCLHHLCPSLYAVLSDGLKDEIDTPFGPIRNSVWSVVEASSQNGPMTQTLNELVQRLNRDDVFTEGLIKFNAFIFGLMNARALNGWFSYLRTRDGLLRKYYDSSGLFLMANSAGAPVPNLVNQLINILEPLSRIRFSLDLMYQTKLLHCSLQNINHLLEDADNNAFLTPTKQLMLMKLVQSIQNSLSQIGEGKKSKQILKELDEKTSDPPVASLLENKSVRIRQRVNKARPRSGCDILGQGEISDVTAALQKRWSGVHINSKLVEAFDKLGNESESDYTDSLDLPKKSPEKSSRKTVSDAPTRKVSERIGICRDDEDTNTKEQKKNILLNLNKKSGGKADSKTDLDVRKKREISSPPHSSQKGGHKFKHLQQKWEKLSGQSGTAREPQTKSNTRPSSASLEKISCDINSTNLQSPTSRTSKIPRLVTSPSSAAPAPVNKGTKKILSPTANHTANNIQKQVKGNHVSERSESSELKLANRLSRCDDKPNVMATGSLGKGPVARPTSLPYKGNSVMSTTKKEAISRRSASISLNRKTTPKKLQVQRTVRTLTHRLASDSGHLSFNEGEELKVVLEVDKTWLLCCRGSQKGLVPKSAVISDLKF